MNNKQLTLNHYSIAVIRKNRPTWDPYTRRETAKYILTIHRADTGYTVHSGEHRTLKECEKVAKEWFKMKYFGGVIIHAYV